MAAVPHHPPSPTSPTRAESVCASGASVRLVSADGDLTQRCIDPRRLATPRRFGAIRPKPLRPRNPRRHPRLGGRRASLLRPGHRLHHGHRHPATRRTTLSPPLQRWRRRQPGFTSTAAPARRRHASIPPTVIPSAGPSACSSPRASAHPDAYQKLRRLQGPLQAPLLRPQRLPRRRHNGSRLGGRRPRRDPAPRPGPLGRRASRGATGGATHQHAAAPLLTRAPTRTETRADRADPGSVPPLAGQQPEHLDTPRFVSGGSPDTILPWRSAGPRTSARSR